MTHCLRHSKANTHSTHTCTHTASPPTHSTHSHCSFFERTTTTYYSLSFLQTLIDSSSRLLSTLYSLSSSPFPLPPSFLIMGNAQGCLDLLACEVCAGLCACEACSCADCLCNDCFNCICPCCMPGMYGGSMGGPVVV